jgi:hypothetical protein
MLLPPFLFFIPSVDIVVRKGSPWLKLLNLKTFPIITCDFGKDGLVIT